MVINMRYAVDEIIDNKVNLENLDNGEIVCVDKSSDNEQVPFKALA